MFTTSISPQLDSECNPVFEILRVPFLNNFLLLALEATS